jgi:hypothetical protein
VNGAQQWLGEAEFVKGHGNPKRGVGLSLSMRGASRRQRGVASSVFDAGVGATQAQSEMTSAQ